MDFHLRWLSEEGGWAGTESGTGWQGRQGGVRVRNGIGIMTALRVRVRVDFGLILVWTQANFSPLLRRR